MRVQRKTIWPNDQKNRLGLTRLLWYLRATIPYLLASSFAYLFGFTLARHLSSALLYNTLLAGAPLWTYRALGRSSKRLLLARIELRFFNVYRLRISIDGKCVCNVKPLGQMTKRTGWGLQGHSGIYAPQHQTPLHFVAKSNRWQLAEVCGVADVVAVVS